MIPEPDLAYIQSKRHPSGAADAASQSSWYETTEIIRHTYQKGVYRHQLLFPDTNALFVIPFTGGTKASPIVNTSFGSVFDPRSRLFEIHDMGKLSRWNTYLVDSIWIFFQYFRFNTDTAMVDTLVLSTFNKAAMQKGFPSEYAGAVNYNSSTNTVFGSGVKTVKIPLTKEMETQEGNSMAIPVSHTIAGGAPGENWFGTAVSYKPAYHNYPLNAPFDTVADFTQVNQNKSSYVNAFRLLTYLDESKFVESADIPPLNQFGYRILNHGIVASKEQRYRLLASDGTLVDYYYPSFYSSHHLFPVVDVHISANNLSRTSKSSFFIKEAMQRGEYLTFNDKLSELQLISLSGQTLFNLKNVSKLNSTDIKEGLYLLRGKYQGAYFSSKLLIY